MAYGQGWFGRLIEKWVGEPVDRLMVRLSPDYLFVRRLERAAGDDAAFARIMQNPPKGSLLQWSRSADRALLALENKLANGTTRANALNRAMIHNLYSANAYWSNAVNKSVPCEHWETNIASYLTSGYLQLMRHGATDALQARYDQDTQFFMSIRYQAFAHSFALGRQNVIRAVNADPALFQNWDDATILALGANALHPNNQTQNGHVDARYLPASIIARHVNITAQKTGSLSAALALLNGIPGTLEYRHAALAIYAGMVEAVNAGVQVIYDHKNAALGDALAPLLSSADAWQALGKRVIDSVEAPKKDDVLAKLVRTDIIGKPAHDLPDDAHQRLFDGVQAALAARLKHTDAARKRVAGLLDKVQDYVAFGGKDGTQTIVLKKPAAEARAEMAETQKKIFTRSPIRAAIMDTFNTLARAKTPQQYDETLRAHNERRFKALLDNAVTTHSLDGVFAQMMQLQGSNINTRLRMIAFNAMVEAVKAGVPATITTQDPAQRAVADQLEILLKSNDPWHALGRVMVLTNGPSQSAHPLGDLVNIHAAAHSAAALSDDINDRLLGGVMSGMRSTITAKKRGAITKVERCLRALNTVAVIKSQDGTTVHAALNALCRENERYRFEREAAARKMERLVHEDPMLLLNRALKPGASVSLTYPRATNVESAKSAAAALDIALNGDDRVVVPFTRQKRPAFDAGRIAASL